jgi:hypothetical protein
MRNVGSGVHIDRNTSLYPNGRRVGLHFKCTAAFDLHAGSKRR